MAHFTRRSVLTAGLATAAALGGSTVSAFAQQHASSAELSKTPPLGDKWMGSDNAPVTMIEYASATCPHCAVFHADTFPKIKSEFIETGKVRFTMREFPFDDLSLAAFMVARCAPEERYFLVLDVLFERQKVWTRNNPKGELFKIAKLAGFTEKSFEACLTNEKIARGIVDARNHAQRTLGVNSTPTFFINGEKLTGNQPIRRFREIFEAKIG